MNVGAMPFVVPQSKPIAPTTGGKIANQRTNSIHSEKPGKFGEVFNKMVANNQLASTKNNDSGEVANNIAEVEQLLNAKSVEEVLDLLGISHDEGLLMITVGEEGKIVPIDELINSEELLALLNLDLQQLNEMVQNLLGEDVVIENIWDLIQLANEEPKFMAQIASILQGEENGSPKEATQLLQLLKLAQVVGEQSDLKFNQPEQLSSLKNVLQTMASTVVKEVTTTGKVSIEGFEKVTKQVETKVETSTTAPNTNVQQTTTTKTVTVTLPNTNSTAQSEALVKQIEAVLARSQMSNTQGTMKILLKLYPENLGSIRIELMQKDGMISARLLASTAIGKELLDSQVHQLKQAFVQQNIQLDRIDIQQSLQESSLRDQNLFNNMFNGGQNQEEDEKSENQNDDDEKQSFKDYLINEEV